MSEFKPKLEILPPAQLNLWQRLAPAAQSGFVLYGGTAIALYEGHRESIDFDFFHDLDLNKSDLVRQMPFLKDATVLQDEPNAYSLQTSGAEIGGVKLSFFGGIGFGRVGAPLLTADRTLVVASRLDLLATKLKVLLQRVELKDYLDIDVLIASGISLDVGSAAAKALFREFPQSEAMRALAWFDDRRLDELSQVCRVRLISQSRGAKASAPLELISKSLSDSDLIAEISACSQTAPSEYETDPIP